MGAASVRLFHQEGAKVLIGDLSEGAGKALAAELGDGVAFQRLNVADEADWTAAVDAASALNRPGTPTEVANVVAFLASDAAAYVSAAEIAVDGGGMAGVTAQLTGILTSLAEQG